MTITETVQSRRSNWVKALNSERYEQGFGQLIRYYKPRQWAYCCIGVACNVITDEGDDEPIISKIDVNQQEPLFDEGWAYEVTEELLVFDLKMKKYLISMNDGSYVLMDKDPNYSDIVTTYSQRKDFPNDFKIIRNTNDRRDFKYIARFLEIAWRLTDTTTVPGVNQTNTA